MSAIVTKVTEANSRVFLNLSSKLGLKDKEIDLQAMIILLLGLMVVVLPLEIGQATFAFVGALCYAAIQASRKSTRRTLNKKEKVNKWDEASGKWDSPEFKGKARSAKPVQKREAVNPAGKQDYRQESSQPVKARIFSANDFESQVQELLGQISPTPEGAKLVDDIVSAAKQALSKFIPENEFDVMGFASGDVLRGTAFAVAIPEVDIILSASPAVFVECLQNHATRPLTIASKLDAWKLQKSMLRACTDELTCSSHFKFRRSAFKGQEPKVTLMAEIKGQAIPIDFSVNTVTPLYNAALLTECGQIEPRAKDLILLVRRWAKDRGISHAAKGHLAPYAWSLLTIYFLQVWDSQHEPLLPKMTSFKMSSSLLRKQQKEHNEQQSDLKRPPARGADKQTASVATLFQGFLSFYSSDFNFRKEAVSVRAGARQPPSNSLPLHIVTLENGSSDVAPSIEDPFAPRHNLSEAMTGISLGRLREELHRATELTSQGASLSTVLEPWVPPERGAAGSNETPSGMEDKVWKTHQ